MGIFDLTGKVAVVTGSARGIGQAIAIELARAGADVVVSDIIPEEGTIAQIKKLKRKAIYVKTDVSKKKDVENLINETIKTFKKIDIMVSNAGIFQGGASETLKEENWQKTIDINLRGCFFCSQAAAKEMMKKKKGSIVNIASVAGLMGSSQAAAYCASKGGIINLTNSLAAEWGKYGIRINTICPGIIETAMTKDMLASKQTKQGMLAKIPLGRTGQPIDIAGAAVFLASDASSYLTGEDIIVDGGWTCTL